MTEPLYPLTLKQNIAMERIWRDARWLVGANPELPAAGVRSDFARLMTVGSTFPKYRPTQTRNAALFELTQELPTVIVQFIGENLWGNVRLTIGSISIEIDCRADQETLRSRLNFTTDYCRATVFPGLWEFAFGRDIGDIPAVSCEPVVTSNSVRFLGGCVVTREGWRSVSQNGVNYDTVKVIDGIPFIEGEVKLGSMAICNRIGTDLYLAGPWHCPAFTFRSV